VGRVAVQGIGILGAGRMGRGLGLAWARAGRRVVLGSRDPEGLARGWTGERPPSLGFARHADAVREPVVVLATPFRATQELVRAHREALLGKVVVDITNPFGAAPPGVAGVAVHREALGGQARWVAAFKTNFWNTIGAPDGIRRQCFVATDDPEARAVADELARLAGYEPVDAGGLGNALALDLMVPLMIELDGRYGGGARSSWRFEVPGR
jgi:predicted dinucleotide-binding enzyme